MSLKTALKKILGATRNSPHQRITRASSWEEACRLAGRYDADLVNRFRVDRAKRAADPSLLLNNILGLAARLIGSPDFSVTDFGGATGDLGRSLLLAYPAAKYTVVENPTLVGLMRDKIESINFTTEMPPSCDIFYTSGTLQYLDDPYGILQKGFTSAGRLVVLVRNSFSDADQFAAQVSPLFDNGGGPLPKGYENQMISYPHRTIMEPRVEALAKAEGFRLIARLDEYSGALGDSYGKQLIFERT